MKVVGLAPTKSWGINRRSVLSAASAIMLAGSLALGSAWPALAQADTSITVVGPIEPNSLDVCESSNQAPGRITRQNVFETLTETSSDDGSVLPRLATEWEQINDTTWRFHPVSYTHLTLPTTERV